MPGLNPKVALHRLAVKMDLQPVKQGQRRFCPELVPSIEVEINRLIDARFIREVVHPTWLSNIVPVRKKNGQIRVIPFGLKNAGTTYQRAMQKIFDDMLHKNIKYYVDDLVVKSVKRKDHPKDLRAVFERLRRYQLEMNPLKCAFGVTSGKFLGKCQPFSKLMKKGAPFTWDAAYSAAFQDIKSYLISLPVLAAPIQGNPLILYITAQVQSVGALLAQENYEEKLCLALIFAIKTEALFPGSYGKLDLKSESDQIRNV
ncbi:hypothetical protein LIER_10406 [Lithospermum erythrorhizon]|uniref:Reverse transcriptase domain-containing protein n=1 Tax=Lithospermum erythrorhizon TaxID=34254 RepID=A0AAV3PKG3_LITER